MSSFLVEVTPPATEPIDLATLKMHLHVDTSDEDLLITSHIEAARRWAESYTRRALIEQTWSLTLDGFPLDGPLELPLPPLQSVTHVKYYDAGGTLQTWSSLEYTVLKPVGSAAERGAIVPAVGKSWPSHQVRLDAVVVQFVCGYGSSATAVPAGIGSAMLLYAGELYKNREQSVSGMSVSRTPLSAEDLLGPFRSVRAA